MSKSKNERYTIAVDFDGVIHSYTSPWINAITIPDPPVEGAIDWLVEMSKSFDIVIFTTRGKTEEGRLAVIAYLLKNGLREKMAQQHLTSSFGVTAEKPPALIYLDDRAYRFNGPGSFPTKDQIHAAKPWNKG